MRVTVGTMIGYLCFKGIHRLAIEKNHFGSDARKLRHMPVVVIVLVFILGFFS